MIKNNNVLITYKNGTNEIISRLLFKGTLAARRSDIKEYVYLNNTKLIYKLY